MTERENIQKQHAANIQQIARDITTIRRQGWDLYDFYLTNNYQGNPPTFANFNNLNAVDLMTTYLSLDDLMNNRAVPNTPRRRIWDLWVLNTEKREPVIPTNADTDAEQLWASNGIAWVKLLYDALAKAQNYSEFWITQTTTATPVWTQLEYDATLGRDGANPLYRFGWAETSAMNIFMVSGFLPYGNSGAVATADYKVNLGAVR